MNPSAAEILEAIEAVPTDDVLVLPNNSNVILTAEQAADAEHEERSRHPVELRAGGLRGHEPLSAHCVGRGERAGDAGRARGRRDGRDHDRVARRDARRRRHQEGAYLGLVDGTAIASGPSLDVVAHEVVDRVLADGKSVLTILTGEDAPALDGLLSALETRHPDLEVVDVHEGGQPHYPLLVVAQ